MIMVNEVIMIIKYYSLTNNIVNTHLYMRIKMAVMTNVYITQISS